MDNARNGAMLRITHSDRVPEKCSGVAWAKDNVRLRSLVRDGLLILPAKLQGHDELAQLEVRADSPNVNS